MLWPLCQNNDKSKAAILLFFFFISSLAVEIDLNVNERPAESSRQQRWIGSHVDFNLG